MDGVYDFVMCLQTATWFVCAGNRFYDFCDFSNYFVPLPGAGMALRQLQDSCPAIRELNGSFRVT